MLEAGAGPLHVGPTDLGGRRDVVAPEVTVPVLRKPSGEEGHSVPSVPSSPFPRARAL